MARGRSTEEAPQVQLVRPSGDIIALGTYLRARQIATQFQEKVDEAFTWAQEVLIEAKRTFERYGSGILSGNFYVQLICTSVCRICILHLSVSYTVSVVKIKGR